MWMSRKILTGTLAEPSAHFLPSRTVYVRRQRGARGSLGASTPAPYVPHPPKLQANPLTVQGLWH